jgi:hypothetical protein
MVWLDSEYLSQQSRAEGYSGGDVFGLTDTGLELN